MSIPLVGFPTYRPYNNITPFTYRDGATYLEVLEDLRNWLKDDLVVYLNTEMEGVTTDFQNQVSALIVAFNTALDGVNDGITHVDEVNEAINEIFQALGPIAQQVHDEWVDVQQWHTDIAPGEPNGTATLDANGHIPSDQLPGGLTNVINVLDFGAVGNGVADEKAAFDAAMLAVPDGGRMVIPAGTYNNVQLRATGKSLTIQADKATLVATVATSIISFDGVWDTPVAVTAVTTSSVDIGSGSFPVTRLAMISSAAFKKGDRVFVFANDVIPEDRPVAGADNVSAKSRNGQWATIGSVGSGYIELTATLLDTYSLNVRVAKLLPTSVNIIGDLTLDVSDAIYAGTSNFNLVNLKSLTNPVVQGLNINRGVGAGIVFRSCYGYTISDYNINNLLDNLINLQLGYAIHDRSSSYGNIGSGVVSNCRHGFSDDTTDTLSDNADPANYGRPWFWTIDGMKVTGSSSGGISPHQAGDGGTIRNCLVTNSAVIGIGIRGRNHTVIDCVVRNCANAYSAFTDTTGAKTYNIRFVNCVAFAEGSSGITGFSFTTDPDPAVLVATIVGGSMSGYRRMLQVQRCRVEIEGNPVWTVAPAMGSQLECINVLASGVLGVDSLTIDARQNASGDGSGRVFRLAASTALKIRKMFMRNTTGFDTRFPTFVSGADATPVTVIDGLVFDTAPAYLSALVSFGAIINGKTTDGTSYSEWKSLNGIKSGVVFRDHTNAVSGAISPFYESANDLFIIVVATASGNRVLNTIGAGHHIGQRLTITWKMLTSGSLTINSGAGTTFPAAAAIVLADMESATLVWDGTTWRNNVK